MILGIVLGVIGTLLIDRLFLNKRRREDTSSYHKGYKKGYKLGFNDGYKNAISKSFKNR